MDFQEASTAFEQLLSSVKATDTEKFLIWAKRTVNDYLEELKSQDNASVVLDSIRDDIRQHLPVEATAQTEHFIQPTTGPNADCDPRTTVHMDAFLYDEDDVDDLVDEGKMSRNYCVDCLSKSVKPLTFITHSASVSQIKFMFQYLLPDMRGKTILDVGSRTGAVLYGAYLYSEAPCIAGVEIDKTFCELQQTIVEKYSMTDRVKIIHSDILLQGEMLKNSDVVILNNVFEFFMPAEQQIQLWKFVYETVRKKDALLITIPSIEESLGNINAPVDLASWLKPVDTDELKTSAALKYFTDIEDSDLDEIFMYQVV